MSQLERDPDASIELDDYDPGESIFPIFQVNVPLPANVRSPMRGSAPSEDIAHSRSEDGGAERASEEVLEFYRQIGSVAGEAYCIRSLGDIALGRSDLDGASRAYAEALTLYQRVEDVLGQASCFQRLGDIARRRSDDDGARKAYEEARALYRQAWMAAKQPGGWSPHRRFERKHP